MFRFARRFLFRLFVVVVLVALGAALLTGMASAATDTHTADPAPSEGHQEYGMALLDSPSHPVRSERDARGGDVLGHLVPQQVYRVQTTNSDSVVGVELDGTQGWVNSRALVVLPDEPSEEDFAKDGTITGEVPGRVSDASRWKLFRLPHIEAPSAGTLRYGQRVSAAPTHIFNYRNEAPMTPVMTEDGVIGWTFTSSVRITGDSGNWDTEVLEEHVPLLESATERSPHVCQLYAGEEVRISNPDGYYLPVDHGSDVGYIALDQPGRFRDRFAEHLAGLEDAAGDVTDKAAELNDSEATEEKAEEAGGEVVPGLVSCAELDGRPAPEAAVTEEPQGAEATEDATDTEEPAGDDNNEPAGDVTDEATKDATAAPAEESDANTDEVSAQEESPEASGVSWLLPLVGVAGLVVLLVVIGLVAKHKRKDGGTDEDDRPEDDIPGTFDDRPEDDTPGTFDDRSAPAATEQAPAAPGSDEDYDDYEDAGDSTTADPLAALFAKKNEED